MVGKPLRVFQGVDTLLVLIPLVALCEMTLKSGIALLIV
jgi:hypothetical protein